MTNTQISMLYSPDPEFHKLYSIYTADPDSIGSHLNTLYGHASSDDPLLVVTGSDMVIFPGGGQPPLVESFRLSTRGFVELTAISHLGVAVPYLLRLKELGFKNWNEDAQRLNEQVARVQAANSETYWRETVAVEAWQGLESKIAALIDYSCAATSDLLQRWLSNSDLVSWPYLRDHFLDSVNLEEMPVPMNDMMAATFSLVFLDTAFRVFRWLGAQELDWSRTMVIIAGRAGRPTAGLTWQTNSMCPLLWHASRKKLPPDHVYIAPHAPGLVLSDLSQPHAIADIEAQFRQIWFSSRATVDIGRLMYDAYPGFQRVIDAAPVLDEATQTLGEIPRVTSDRDRRAIITRLRFVMEDPGQQLVNASAQFMIDQLAENGNRPELVVIPGFTNTVYPPWRERRTCGAPKNLELPNVKE